MRSRNLTSMYEAGLREMEGELRALQAHEWGQPGEAGQAWAALGRARGLTVRRPAEEVCEADGGLARLGGHVAGLRRQAAVLDALMLMGRGDAEQGQGALLASLQVSRSVGVRVCL